MILIRSESFKRILISLVCGLSSISIAQTTTLQVLDDSALSDITGQALMSLTYIAPTDSTNKMVGQGVGFYKLGMEADLELNANINKLQLGCGGINGANGCDIDIDNLSLSGLSSDTRDGRASSSAKLTNPFLEFAIKNPDLASTREIVGLRLSAEKVLGMLTAGTENSTSPSGINSLSGYMKINSTTGTGYTAARNMSYSDTQKSIDGSVKTSFLFFPLTLGFKSTDYNLELDSTKADIFLNGTTILGSRMSRVKLDGYANINQLNFAGQLGASLNASGGLLTLQKQVTGNITGLKANVTVDENLGFIHKIPLNNPFSLSMQTGSVWWPGAAAAAKNGWWMAFEDTIDIGNVSPSQKIEITNDVLKQVVDPISGFLKSNPIPCSLLNCIGGTGLAVGNVNLPNTTLDFPLKDLQLTNQSFAPNCYGNLKFC